jgi:hypothetical protein
MSQHAESTLMESHSLYMSIFHKITRITYTAQVVQLALANQALLLPCHHQRISAQYQDFSRVRV